MVLAAGRGRRVGAPKALLRAGATLLVDQALTLVREAGCAPVLVVLGAAADQVRAQAGLDEATVVANRAWGTGEGSSWRAGLRALAGTEAESVLVIPVDMPGLTTDAIWRVGAEAYRDSLACASYGGRRSYPMLVGRDHWSGLSTLAAADTGARPYLLARSAHLRVVPCDDVADGTDVDTLAEVHQLGLCLPPGG